MKKIQLLIFLLTLSVFTFAQTTLKLTDAQGNIIPNGGSRTYTTTADVAIVPGDYMLYLHNTGTEEIPILCSKEIIDTIAGTDVAFCWGQCFGEITYTSPQPGVYVAVGDSDIFNPDYAPNGFVGTSHVRYVFSENGNRDNQTAFYVTFIATPSSVNSYAQNNNKIIISPNPASNQINIDYSLQDNINSITIKNMLGAVVYSSNVAISSGKVSINSSEFVDGIYFVTSASNGTPVNTKKLIIKH